MSTVRLTTWLGRLRVTATFVSIAALCAAVALLVIAFIPGSPVKLELPTKVLTRLDGVRGVASGAVVDPHGWVDLKISDPSLGQRLIQLAILLPGLLLVAELARRMAALLRTALETDPFTARTARELKVLATITAIGGVAVWAVSNIAWWGLATTVLDDSASLQPRHSPLGWLAVGLVFAGFAALINRGVEMRAELDTVI
jgi:hypothetical protein